ARNHFLRLGNLFDFGLMASARISPAIFRDALIGAAALRPCAAHGTLKDVLLDRIWASSCILRESDLVDLGLVAAIRISAAVIREAFERAAGARPRATNG